MTYFVLAVVVVCAFILPRVVGRETPVDSAFQIFEAESTTFTTSYNCLVRDKHKNYSGTGFVDFQGVGAWLEWKIWAKLPVKEIAFRYSAGNLGRPVQLLVDGEPTWTLSMTQTVDHNSWDTERVAVGLSKGDHTIRLFARDSGGPNIDWMALHFDHGATPSDDNGGAPTAQPDVTSFSPPQSLPLASNSIPVSRSGIPHSIAIQSDQSISRNEYIASPNGIYSVGLDNSGDLILARNGQRIWSVGSVGAEKAYMQSEGNLVLRGPDRQLTWNARTGKHPGAYLQIDDAGQVAVMLNDSSLWIGGIPRGSYGGAPPSLEIPIRGAFYYPWYPGGWSVNGIPVAYQPHLGKYSNGDEIVQQKHVDALNYARMDVAIASWWGPGEKNDRSRITNLMDKSKGTRLKWTVYHEEEYHSPNQSAGELRKDLDYLRKWFAWHETWAHVDGRPLIFVYNEVSCDVSARWVSASNGDWYVVLKLFKGFEHCLFQPDAWHQYGPGSAANVKEGHSFSISPGFWRADISSPSLPRLSENEWRQVVTDMVDSNESLQLLTTFNEWGEGTAAEGAKEWRSDSGFGYYLDALNQIY